MAEHPPTSSTVDSRAAVEYFRDLQNHIVAQLEAFETRVRFKADTWQRPEGGGGDTRVLADGETFERAGVNFSLVNGDKLPASASARRPELAGRSFTASGVSVVVHPRNPYVPTSHANVRLFVAHKPDEPPVWWFGGGFDLTPYYPFTEDAVAWHQAAHAACAPFGETLYPRFKAWCDEYFYLPHRNETRGIGGLFFDDFDELDFPDALAFARAVGDGFINAYTSIVARRNGHEWGDRERKFQLYRRGRYVEFNLLHDRGTLFGLQSHGRVESILMSMPPLAAWQYGFSAAPDSPEAKLTEYFLRPRNWLA